ncbi:MAG: NAD(P)-binding domain-containing protein [Acidobacteriota bacterium]
METLIAFVIGFGITFVFVMRYVRRQAPALGKKAATAPSGTLPNTGQACPRCGKPVFEGSSFCAACGVPLTLWKVHRSPVQSQAPSQASQKPRPVINATLCIGCGSCVQACPETGTLELVNGKAILAYPERCTGHAKCSEVCPTSAIVLAYGDVLQTLRVPLVRENFETNVQGLYIVGEAGGMGLIKTAINEGRLVIDHIRRRLQECGSSKGIQPVNGKSARRSGDLYDVVIVGAGPSGLSASLTALQCGLKYLTLEQGEVASTIRQYPRHKFLMAEPVEMPLYGSLYIGDGTKESLLSVWETIIANTGVQVCTNERVEWVRRDPDREFFSVGTPKGSYLASFIVLALGKRGTPRRLGVPGEQLSKVAYRLIEAESYLGQDILVVGGGDSAIEAALALSAGQRNRVTLSHRRADFSKACERNRMRLQEAERDGRVQVARESQVVEIREQTVVLSCQGKVTELSNNFLFVMIGGEPPEEFLRRAGVEIVEKAIAG